MASKSGSTTSPLQVYLNQIQAAAGSVPTFDAARYRAMADAAAQNSKTAIQWQGAALAYKLAELAQQRQQQDQQQNAAIQQQGQQFSQAQAATQQGAQTDVAAQAAAGQNANAAPPPGQAPPDPNAPQAPTPPQAPVQPPAPAGAVAAALPQNNLQAALEDQTNRQSQYSQRLSQVADRNATERQAGATQITNSALNQVEVNRSAAQAAVGQLEAQVAAAAQQAASGGGGGGSGGGGGGGSSSGDSIPAGLNTALAKAETPGIDYRGVATQTAGKIPPPSVVQDVLYGKTGGVKGHVAPDLSNLNQAFDLQIARWHQNVKAGRRNGYSLTSLLNLRDKLRKNVMAAQKDAMNRAINLNVIRGYGVGG